MYWYAVWTSLFALTLLPLGLCASPPARTITPFKLPDLDGKSWSLDDDKDYKASVIVFIGTQCPINNAYMPRLIELEKTYRAKGVRLAAINANSHDGPQGIAEHAKKYGLTFPVLRDEKHLAANRFGVQRHPTVYLLDEKHVVRYQGRIDDQYGVGFHRPAPTRRDLVEALEEVLAGKTVSVPTTPVEGCYITKQPAVKGIKTNITYTREIAPILQNRCQECHRPGQIGPMALLSYDDASSWSEMIREVVQDRRMPPWHADPKHGKFRNDRRLSTEESEKVLRWIDAGCPRGDERDLPEPRKYIAGWNIGKPDAVFTMANSFTVPAQAKGGIPYKYYRIPTSFEEDRWIQAVEAKPGNNAVVHHIIGYIFANGKRTREIGDGIGSGMLVAYAPGDLGATFAPGTAKKLPKGASLVLQMHYTPNGTEQTDRSSIGVVFAKQPPQREVKTRAIAQQAFLIPPGAANHKVVSKTTFSKDVILYSLFPHMHLRGKSFQFEVIFPDGKRDTLLSVPRYDFGWQANYLLEKPIRLAAGTKIECTAIFDNSALNPNNPNPLSLVYWGDQTWQEMMIGFVDYALADGSDGKE